jgi:hypothetical protein
MSAVDGYIRESDMVVRRGALSSELSTTGLGKKNLSRVLFPVGVPRCGAYIKVMAIRDVESKDVIVIVLSSVSVFRRVLLFSMDPV